MWPDAKTERKEEKGNEGGQCPQSQIKASPSLLPPRLSKPLPGSRRVSRYSCLSVSSFGRRERKRGTDRKGGEAGQCHKRAEAGWAFLEKQRRSQVQMDAETLVVWLPCGVLFFLNNVNVLRNIRPSQTLHLPLTLSSYFCRNRNSPKKKEKEVNFYTGVLRTESRLI